MVDLSPGLLPESIWQIGQPFEDAGIRLVLWSEAALTVYGSTTYLIVRDRFSSVSEMSERL